MRLEPRQTLCLDGKRCYRHSGVGPGPEQAERREGVTAMASPVLSRLLLASALAVPLPLLPAAAADKVGEAVRVATQVSGQNGALARGDGIFRDERIRSNASGNGAFVFADGTKLAVGPNSVVVIDEYVYSGGSTVKKLALGATRGTLRWISGKSDHSAYRIETPSGTLGVRGTAFDIYVGPGGTTAVTLLNGSATFCGDRGCQTLNRRCEFIVARKGKPVTRPRGVSPEIGIDVSGLQAFPFLAGTQSLPRGFRATSRCEGLTAGTTGQSGNNRPKSNPPPERSKPAPRDNPDDKPGTNPGNNLNNGP